VVPADVGSGDVPSAHVRVWLADPGVHGGGLVLTNSHSARRVSCLVG
jgi:hypothetical protein